MAIFRLPGDVAPKPSKRIQDYRIAVSPPVYDNMLPVLQGMGLQAAQVPNSILANEKQLREYDLYFANCGSQSCSWAQPAVVQSYVGKGGVILASDWESALISRCFPGVLSFEGLASGGAAGACKAQVVDEELQQIIGSSITLRFDLPGWHAPSSVSQQSLNIGALTASPVTVHLQGCKPYRQGWLRSDTVTRPLLISFSYGKGHIIYTSFHNKAQASDKERELIKYLALKPLSVASGTQLLTLYKQLGQKV